MQVTLLRHGIAVDRGDPTHPRGADRPLTSKGERRTRASCEGLAAMDVRPELILTSPRARARQTAAIAAEVLGCDRIEETDALLGGAHPGLLFQELARRSEERVLCVGHAPHLDLVLAQAIHSGQASLVQLKKAGAARVAFDQVAAGSGHLEWQLQPKALRALGETTAGELP